MTNDELRGHISKMEGIHGDEPIRIKIVLPWARELLRLREQIGWRTAGPTKPEARYAVPVDKFPPIPFPKL